MALIKCPNCGKEVSDKAKKCVHCGEIIKKRKTKCCKECGCELQDNETVCSKCGCPVQQIKLPKIKKPKTKDIIIIGIIIVVLVFMFSYIFAMHDKIKTTSDEIHDAYKTPKKNKYKSELEDASYKILSSAADAEECGNIIRKVWYNSIWEEEDPETDKYTKKDGVFNEDFNDSLQALFRDEYYISLTDKIKTDKKDILSQIKDLEDPPSTWEDAYNELKEYHDSYLTMANLCINPSGNITSFTSKFNEADSDTLDHYNRLKDYLES